MHHNLGNSYSIKIKKQTRKLGTDCSKHRFKVVDRTDEVSSKTDEVSSKHCFEVADRTDEVRFEVADRTDEVSNHTHDKPTLTWFEEIFEEYHSPFHN
ncbi:hypothetical protein [Streptococcus pneumoniae]|uniref:hypothetical protein n=1 Tax=Streptococcus pneumoniae TaxID=1313 RepID=UPI000B749313|nr:hypothetical protein [Streptococcus pneumoniae]SNK36153.1 chlorohydrolase [Streptococcus pneumoniae]